MQYSVTTVKTVLLSWRNGNINLTVSMLQCSVPFQWCTVALAVLAGRLTISGIDLAWFSSLSPYCLCVFDLRGDMYRLIFLVTPFSLPFSELILVGLILDLVY